jgi:digeranylgeranylglycerophospholipid reductase
VDAYDAVIVGAGPSGGRAGMELTRAGHSVLFLDKRDVVGVPVQCGEGLSTFGLRSVGLSEDPSWIRERVKGIRAMLPDGTNFRVTLPGYCLDRAKFDQWIVQQALDRGAEIRLRTRATGVRRENGGWIIETDRGDSIRAKLLIGADGPASNVARWNGLLQDRRYAKAIEYRFAAEDWSYPCDGWLIFFYAQKYRGGYAWVFPKNGFYDIGVMAFGKATGLMAVLCEELQVPMDRIVKKTGGDIPHTYRLSSLAAPGLAIIGDAAGMTNPVYGGGIHPALHSGKVAGEVAVEALKRGDMNHMLEHDRRIRQSPFFDDILWKTSKLFASWDDAHYNFAGDVLDHRDTKELSSAGILWRLLTRHPKYLLELRDLMTMRQGLRLTQRYGW